MTSTLLLSPMSSPQYPPNMSDYPGVHQPPRKAPTTPQLPSSPSTSSLVSRTSSTSSRTLRPASSVAHSPVSSFPHKMQSQSSLRSAASSSLVDTARHSRYMSVDSKPKRHSRFPWSKKSTSGHSSSNSSSSIHSLASSGLSISAPILEFSTSDLVPEHRYSMITPRNSSSHMVHTHSQSHSSHQYAQPQYSSHQYSQPQAHAQAHAQGPHPSYQTINSHQLPPQDRGPADRRVSAFEQQQHQRTISRESSFTQASVYSSNKTSPASATHADKAEEHIKELNQKLRESEEKRRLMMVEYQQKIDNERRRNLTLQKKLDDSRNPAVSEPLAPSPRLSSSSPSPASLSEKIKAFETQRKALREAMNSLRVTKDIEITALREQNDRLRAGTLSNSSSFRHSPSSSVTSSPIPLKHTSSVLARQRAQSSPTRLGFGPFLPVAGPSPPQPMSQKLVH